MDLDQHIFLLKTIAFACSALLLVAGPGAAAETTVFEKADAPWRPALAPRPSDVVMRSMRPHPSSHDDEYNSIQAAQDFHVTRHEWTYLAHPDDAGGLDWSRAFLAEARRIGLLVGGASSGASSQVEASVGRPREEFCVLDLDQQLYVMPHKRGWANPPGQGSVFSADYFRAHFEHLAAQVKLGCDTLQRDEAQMAVGVGFDFSPAAIAAFRVYLGQHSTAEQQRAWGIGAVEVFDVRRYFLGLQPPETRPDGWFARWEKNHPVKRHYETFIAESVALFHRRTRQALNEMAGREIGFSCNNTSQQRWLLPHREFDWGMSELMVRTATPAHMYERVQAGRTLGKVQVFSTPKTADVALEPAALRQLNRQVIAQAYATGALGKVPWDLFMQSDDGSERYFGRPQDYADLYGFVRALAPYLDGFEEAAAVGKGIADSRGWLTPPITLDGATDVFGYVRIRPGAPRSAVVVHLVNWAAGEKSVTVGVRKAAVGWTAGRKVKLLQPAAYDRQSHVWAEFEQNSALLPGEKRGPQHATAYQRLVRSTPLVVRENVDSITLENIIASPWSVIVIE